MSVFKKVIDFVMPPGGEYEEEIVEQTAAKVKEEVAAPAERIVEKKVANGGSYYTGETTYADERRGYSQTASVAKNPRLHVHTSKSPGLKIRLYLPQKFEDVTAIADDLSAKKAVVVNYEKIEPMLQRRICDFINGVCYVLGGDAKRVSGGIVLYVPKGVDVSDALTRTSMSSMSSMSSMPSVTFG